jgi:hypothetical protein
MVIYFVLTGMTTMRRKDGSAPLFDGALMIIPVAIGFVRVMGALQAAGSPDGMAQGVPAFVILLTSVICFLAAYGDARIILHGPLHGTQRLVRHIWRMGYAMFTATGSFFLGQAKVIPAPLRVWPVLIVLAMLPLVVMFYWLWRVRRRRSSAAGFAPARTLEAVT